MLHVVSLGRNGVHEGEGGCGAQLPEMSQVFPQQNGPDSVKEEEKYSVCHWVKTGNWDWGGVEDGVERERRPDGEHRPPAGTEEEPIVSQRCPLPTASPCLKGRNLAPRGVAGYFPEYAICREIEKGRENDL